jgi:2-keto-4-pentenoate hydratase/2-oxohepta-3-ene-1,7-dioic acid hydratase in catechol pathway
MNAPSSILRFARVRFDGQERYVRLDAAGAVLLDRAPWLNPSDVGRLPIEAGSSAAPFLCPVQPSKILGIGRNYADHARELGNTLPTSPLVFLKPPSCLLGPGGTVVLPPESERVDFEGELGVLIGQRVRRISREQALNAVFGLVITCDVTARDLQKSDGQWARAKGFDSFCPVGPIITTGVAADTLSLQLRQNGVLKQDGNTHDMVFGVAELVSHTSQSMTLEPGDLILTGTPAGVGPLAHGDRIEVAIESLGELQFSVSAEPNDLTHP